MSKPSTPKPSMYQEMIRETMARMGRIGAADPRHVEGWMRLDHPTLDHLSASQFTREVKLALECVAAAQPEHSEDIAVSMGI